MELSHEIRRIRSFPSALPIALELLVEQAQYADRDSFLSDVLPIIGDAVSAGQTQRSGTSTILEAKQFGIIVRLCRSIGCSLYQHI